MNIVRSIRYPNSYADCIVLLGDANVTESAASFDGGFRVANTRRRLGEERYLTRNAIVSAFSPVVFTAVGIPLVTFFPSNHIQLFTDGIFPEFASSVLGVQLQDWIRILTRSHIQRDDSTIDTFQQRNPLGIWNRYETRWDTYQDYLFVSPHGQLHMNLDPAVLGLLPFAPPVNQVAATPPRNPPESGVTERRLDLTF